jgi:hypothetical protein
VDSVATDSDAVQERGRKEQKLGLVPALHADDLTQAGWGIVFASDVSADIRAALEPLIAWRKKQVNNDDRFQVFSGARGVGVNESPITWLGRMGVGLTTVDPDNGVPYHLLIIGPPTRITFEFQYTLDLQWSVGRLDFDTAAEFAVYANNVVAYETAETVSQAKNAAMWMPANGDLATNLLCSDVGLPFAQKPLGQKQGFVLTTFLADNATKDNLAGIFSGKAMKNGAPPALLFTGSHGLQVALDSADLRERQGALVCQGWQLAKPVGADVSFSGADLAPDAKLNGLIHVMFACFGNGCPDTDNYPEDGSQPKHIAPTPLISRLPQRLLAKGALAVIGHVDRAWSYAFESGSAIPQNQLLRSIVETILLGLPVGLALDFTNSQWGALAAQLGLLTGPTQVTAPAAANLTNLVIARDDARNYTLFGDPAVRLRVGKMASAV